MRNNNYGPDQEAYEFRQSRDTSIIFWSMIKRSNRFGFTLAEYAWFSKEFHGLDSKKRSET